MVKRGEEAEEEEVEAGGARDRERSAIGQSPAGEHVAKTNRSCGQAPAYDPFLFFIYFCSHRFIKN